MMDKEDIIQLILLEDKNKEYKIDNLINLKKSDLMTILLSLNISYYRKSYKLSKDNWFKLIMENYSYFDLCPKKIKNYFYEHEHISIVNKYPNLRFYFYDLYLNQDNHLSLSMPIYYLENYFNYILINIISLNPEYIHEIENILKEKNILIYLNKKSWIKLIELNPDYYYKKCIHLKGMVYYRSIASRINWKNVVMKNLNFFNELLKYKYTLDEYDWLSILSKYILELNMSKILENILESLESYQWAIIISRNTKLLTNKKYNYYSKYHKNYSKQYNFWNDLLNYNPKLINYITKDDFNILVNTYKDFSKNLIDKNLKYLKLIGLEKFLKLDTTTNSIYFLLEKNFKLLYKIPKKYIRFVYRNNKFKDIFILHNIDIKNLGFYIRFKCESEFINELKKIDKKFKKNYEKFLKYIEEDP